MGNWLVRKTTKEHTSSKYKEWLQPKDKDKKASKINKIRRLKSKQCRRGHGGGPMNSRGFWVTMLVKPPGDKHSKVLGKAVCGFLTRDYPIKPPRRSASGNCWVPQEPRLNSQLQCKSWAQRNLTWLAKTPGMLQALPELDTICKGWPATEISARETTESKGNTSLL